MCNGIGSKRIFFFGQINIGLCRQMRRIYLASKRKYAVQATNVFGVGER